MSMQAEETAGSRIPKCSAGRQRATMVEPATYRLQEQGDDAVGELEGQDAVLEAGAQHRCPRAYEQVQHRPAEARGDRHGALACVQHTRCVFSHGTAPAARCVAQAAWRVMVRCPLARRC